MKGNVLRKRNSISPLSGKSWKKGEKERLPTTSRDGTDPEREVFLSGYEIAQIEKQVDDAISQTGG